MHTACHEGKGFGRGAILPLQIIDDAEQRAVPSHIREQAKDGQADNEPIWRLPSIQPKRGAKGRALRSRQPLKAIEKRRAQLVETGERQLHFGLDAHRSRDLISRGPA